MSLLQYGRRLYSLDTLDTRFTTSSRIPPSAPRIDPAKASPRETSSTETNGATSGAGSPPNNEASSPRWSTPEFILYYLVLLVAIPMMFKVSHDVSKPSDPNYHKYDDLLSPGWIPGRKVDNSDAQYSTFRDNVPYTVVALTLHPLLRKLYGSLFPVRSNPTASHTQTRSIGYHSQSSAADARMNQRVTFDLYFGLVFLCALYGFSALKVLTILYVNFTLATRLPTEYVPATTWIFNIGILFANEFCDGYPFASVASFITPWSAYSGTEAEKGIQSNWGSFLDSYGGLTPRWQILFNFTVLRLISFNLDFCWSLGRGGTSPVEKQLDPANLSERDRVDTPAKPEDYSLRNYLAYVLYSPLYLAGPILTFNDYISQQRYIPQSITTSRILLYGVRFLICLLTMEVMLHYIYVVAISKSQPAWEVYTPFQLSMIGYFNLHIIWLKLLLPWRFFRLWALLDGIDAPENMVRCMSDNYSALAFWRGWHRSFNRWIVRYVYIPLGGSGTQGPWGMARAGFNFLVVFTFVALWHDINLKLLTWGWLITLFILPEVLAGFLFPKRKWQSHKNVYRAICAAGAVGNILMMMAANLVGFAVGLDGLKGLVHGIVGSYSGLVFLATASVALFVGVQVMFEIREQELRRGVKMKC